MSLSPRGKPVQQKIYVYNYLRFVDVISHWDNEVEITNVINLYKQLEVIDTIKQHICNAEPKDEYMSLLNSLLFVRDYIIRYKLFYELQCKYLLREKIKVKSTFYQDNSIKISLIDIPEVIRNNKRLVDRFKELQADYHNFITNINGAKHKLKKLADI